MIQNLLLWDWCVRIGFIIFENLCLALSDIGFWGLRFNLFRYFALMAVLIGKDSSHRHRDAKSTLLALLRKSRYPFSVSCTNYAKIVVEIQLVDFHLLWCQSAILSTNRKVLNFYIFKQMGQNSLPEILHLEYFQASRKFCSQVFKKCRRVFKVSRLVISTTKSHKDANISKHPFLLLLLPQRVSPCHIFFLKVVSF